MNTATTQIYVAYRWLLLVFGSLFITTFTTQADIIVDGNFTPSDASFWTNGGTPFADGTIGDTADGELTVNGGSGLALDDGGLGGESSATGTATISGTDSEWFLADDLDVGVDGTGHLYIENGGWVGSNDGYLGYNPGSFGYGTINGVDSQWYNFTKLVVGDEGTGDLTITNGGTATVDQEYAVLGRFAGSTGTVLVQGSGSTLEVENNDLYVGDIGTGTLNIEQGGTVMVDQLIQIGYDTDSEGSVVVDGSGSSFSSTNDTLEVGTMGSGSLTVSNGAQTTTGDSIVVGVEAESDGQTTVSGTDSELSGIDINVGRAGNGVLNVQDGGQVTASSFLAVGVEVSGTGEVNISGADSNAKGDIVHIGYEGSGTMNVSDSASVTADGDFSVGTFGTGTLTVVNGGTVEVGAESYIGNDATGVGTATVRGGTWEGTRSLTVGNSGTGTLNVSQGSEINIGRDINIGSGSSVNLMVDGNSILNAGLGGEAGWGDFSNNGNVTFIADGALANGTFTPITIAPGRFFGGSGTFTGVGGTWDTENDRFIASEITTDGTGDLSAKRVLYEDDLVVGFGDSVGIQSFAVTKLSVDTIADELVLAAYKFNTAIAELTSLSFIIGEGLDDSLISIWHKADGAEWTLFETEFYSYTDGIFTFVTDEFSSYAVTVVPEPTTAGLLAMALGLVAVRRRR